MRWVSAKPASPLRALFVNQGGKALEPPRFGDLQTLVRLGDELRFRAEIDRGDVAVQGGQPRSEKLVPHVVPPPSRSRRSENRETTLEHLVLVDEDFK